MNRPIGSLGPAETDSERRDEMMSKMGSCFLALGLMAVLPCTGEEPKLRVEDCYNQTIGETVRCGTLEVAENRDRPRDAQITLKFVILPATESRKEPDPIFCFSGGPGESAIDGIDFWAQVMAKMRGQRDVVLLDLRGTGGSNPLKCMRKGPPDSAQTYLQDMYPVDYVQACREELERRANLYVYHTSVAVDDVEELRLALGYGPINIVGGSFGTYTCLVYMNRYPGSVRSAVLLNVATPELPIPAYVAGDTEAAFDSLCADCGADPDCAQDYPDLRGLLNQALARLDQGPVIQEIINPFTQNLETVTFSRNNFITGVRQMLYTAEDSRWLPLMLHLAASGNYAPIAAYTANFLRWANEALMDGEALCVYCSETVPHIDFALARAVAQGTFMGTYRLDQQERACQYWPRGSVPADFYHMNALDIPTLLISGEIDAGCPPHNGEYVQRYLPNSLHIVEPKCGHGTLLWADCLDNLALQLITRGFTTGIDPNIDCIINNKRPSFVSWRDLGPFIGLPAQLSCTEKDKRENMNREGHSAPFRHP